MRVSRRILLLAVLALLLGALFPAEGKTETSRLVGLFYARQWGEFDRILASRPRWSAQEACLAANAAWLRQDRAEAVRILKQYRKDFPPSIRPFGDLLLALGLERTGNQAEAASLGKRLWESNPPAELRYYVAYLNARLAKPAAEKNKWARRMLDSASKDEGRKIQAYSILLSSSTGTEEDAVKLLEIRPLDSRGLEFLRRQGTPGSNSALEVQGVAAALSGKPREAVALFESVAQNPDGTLKLSARGRFWLGLSLYRVDRREEAVPIWERLAMGGGAYSASSVARLASAAAAGVKGAREALEGIASGSVPTAEAALAALAKGEIGAPVSPWRDELFRRFPAGAGSSRLRWETGWTLWKSSEAAKASAEWEQALGGVPEGLERARLLYWLSRAARKTGDENGARDWEKKLASMEPLSVYAWRVFPKGASEVAIKGRKTWNRGTDPLESWGFPVYARLRLETRGKAEGLARAAWLAAWNGDFTESVRLAARSASTLPKGDVRSEAFLSLAHPRAFEAEVLKAAGRFGIEPSLLWAVMRQESAFDPGVVSSAGAVGLMQLMPATARDEAARLGFGAADSWEPSTNILLGAAHLSRHLRDFGSPEKALAAYNAGGGSVRRWAQEPGESLEEWVEGIPYPETNEYVRKVMGNFFVYKALEGKKE